MVRSLTEPKDVEYLKTMEYSYNPGKYHNVHYRLTSVKELDDDGICSTARKEKYSNKHSQICYARLLDDWAESTYMPFMINGYPTSKTGLGTKIDQERTKDIDRIVRWFKFAEKINMNEYVISDEEYLKRTHSIKLFLNGTVKSKLFAVLCHYRYIYEEGLAPEVAIKLVDEFNVGYWLAYGIALQLNRETMHAVNPIRDSDCGDWFSWNKDPLTFKVDLSAIRALRKLSLIPEEVDDRILSPKTACGSWPSATACVLDYKEKTKERTPYYVAFKHFADPAVSEFIIAARLTKDICNAVTALE